MIKYFCYFQIHRTSFLGADVKKRSKRTISQPRYFVPKALLILSFTYYNCNFRYGGSGAFCLTSRDRRKNSGKKLKPKDDRKHLFIFFKLRSLPNYLLFRNGSEWSSHHFESILLPGGANLLPSCPYSNSKVFSINSYIPKKGLCAIAFFDRAWRALREVQAKFRGYSND